MYILKLIICIYSSWEDSTHGVPQGSILGHFIAHENHAKVDITIKI